MSQEIENHAKEGKMIYPKIVYALWHAIKHVSSSSKLNITSTCSWFL